MRNLEFCFFGKFSDSRSKFHTTRTNQIAKIYHRMKVRKQLCFDKAKCGQQHSLRENLCAWVLGTTHTNNIYTLILIVFISLTKSFKRLRLKKETIREQIYHIKEHCLS